MNHSHLWLHWCSYNVQNLSREKKEGATVDRVAVLTTFTVFTNPAKKLTSKLKPPVTIPGAVPHGSKITPTLI